MPTHPKHDVARTPSPTVFVSKLIFAAAGVLLGAGLLADVVRRVTVPTVPLGVLFGGGLIALGALVAALLEVDRRRRARRTDVGAAPRTATGRPTRLRAYRVGEAGLAFVRDGESPHEVMDGVPRRSTPRPPRGLASDRVGRMIVITT